MMEGCQDVRLDLYLPPAATVGAYLSTQQQARRSAWGFFPDLDLSVRDRIGGNSAHLLPLPFRKCVS